MKAAIFDVDGTLIDSVDQHARAWCDAFTEFDHRITFERVRAQIGKGGDQLMPIFLTPEEIEERGKKIEQRRGEIFKTRYLAQVRGFPRVRELMQRLLDEGWKVALASSAKADELQTYKKICEIADLIETETTSDDAEKSKPHPDIFQAALGRLGGLKPRDCLVIGDSPFDAEAAGKAGLRALGLLCGGFDETSLRKAGYEELYNDPADLLARYETWAMKLS